MSLNHEGEQPLGPPPPEQDQKPSSRGSKKVVGAAAAVAVVAVLAVGGVAFAKAMGGGGSQPEDVLPANAIAFAKLDLNPSAGQKLAAYQLISKFPKAKSKVTSQDTSIKETIFGSIFTADSGMGLRYKTDVAPWLGDRVGFGVFPDMDADKKPEIGLAIAFSDQSAAKTALDKAVANAAKKKDRVGYAFADEYVIVSDTTAHAAALVRAGKASALAASTYTEDVKKLGSDQIGVAWVDIAAVYKAVPQDMMMPKDMPKGMSELIPKGMLPTAGTSKASGRVVEGLHADSSYLELIGKGIEIKGADGKAAAAGAGTGTGTGMIASFPSDVFGAVTVNGLGKAAGALYTVSTAKGDSMGVKPMLGEMGIDSAKDIEALFGAETGLAVAGTQDQPQLAVRTRGSDAAAALAIARKALGASPAGEMGVTVKRIAGPDGIVVGMGPDLTGAIFSKSGSRLGSTVAFRQAMPDAGKANFAAFVNLTKTLPILAKDPKAKADMASLKPLSALGLTVTGGADPTVRLRLSVR